MGVSLARQHPNTQVQSQLLMLSQRPREPRPLRLLCVVHGAASAALAPRFLCLLMRADLLAAAHAAQVVLLLRDPYLCKDINERHCNTRYLPVRRQRPDMQGTI